MVNQKRTMLMTKAEIIRSKEERRDLKINRFSRFDYITSSMILTAVSYLIGCVILAVLVGVYYMDELLTGYSPAELVRTGIFAIAVVLAILFVVMLISFFVYRNKYRRAEKTAKEYYLLLKEINHANEQEKAKLWRESGEYRI